MSMRLVMHGAVGTVTGSCALLEMPAGRLLVDCGLFQGNKTLKELNYGPFPFRPRDLDAVLLTHAHIDHSGLLPKLVRHGYRGRILATHESRDLLSYMLPDAGYIQESEVERLNRRRQQRGEAPVAPIYTRADAEAALSSIDAVPYDNWIEPMPGVRARFWPAGHILGSASIELEVDDGHGQWLRLLFSGDLGPAGSPLEPPGSAPSDVDYVILESTYGDRVRPVLAPAQRRRILRDEVVAALHEGGNLIIPAFAVERTQELLFDLGTLFAAGDLPSVPVFLDSPLAIRATQVFKEHANSLGEPAGAARPFDRNNFHFIEAAIDSKALNRIRSGAIIIAASGMCDAGRIRHHLKAHLWRPKSTVLLVGFQAAGTLGRLLQDGIPSVRIEGEEVKVAARIRSLDIYSAHADRDGLTRWLLARQPVRRAVILNHGEPGGRHALGTILRDRLGPGVPVLEPGLDDVVQLDGPGPARVETGHSRLAEVSTPLDWHNRYAAQMLAIQQKLRQTTDPARREALLRRLDAALAGDSPG